MLLQILSPYKLTEKQDKILLRWDSKVPVPIIYLRFIQIT